MADVIEFAGRVPLGIPHVETPDVELKTVIRRRANCFHDELFTADGLLACITVLAI